MSSRRLSFYFLLLALATGAPGAPLLAQTPAAAAVLRTEYGERLHLNGISNAGKINEQLYRGAQPRRGSVAELKKLGVTTIVDLRGEDAALRDREREEAEGLGLRFVSIPVSGWTPPTDAQVAEFLALFRSGPKERVFVHCRFGEDRTGVFVASYRMALEGWTPQKALGEMYFFGFNHFWHPAMRTFVRDFPRRLSEAPELAAFRGPSVAGPRTARQ